MGWRDRESKERVELDVDRRLNKVEDYVNNQIKKELDARAEQFKVRHRLDDLSSVPSLSNSTLVYDGGVAYTGIYITHGVVNGELRLYFLIPSRIELVATNIHREITIRRLRPA